MITSWDSTSRWWINLKELERNQSEPMFVWDDSFFLFPNNASIWEKGYPKLNDEYPVCGQLNSYGRLEDRSCSDDSTAFPICKLGIQFMQ